MVSIPYMRIYIQRAYLINQSIDHSINLYIYTGKRKCKKLISNSVLDGYLANNCPKPPQSYFDTFDDGVDHCSRGVEPQTHGNFYPGVPRSISLPEPTGG